MVLGQRPRIAPASKAVPAYATAPIANRVEIGAYIGVPLKYDDGSLFGTLCTIHPTPQSDAIVAELPLVELLSSLLSRVLNADLRAAQQARYTERARVAARSDALTRLYNRRGWDLLLAYEEKRCRESGYPACVISIDLNRLKQINDIQGHAKGDELIGRAAEALRSVTRKQDVMARVGGDEFVVLSVECTDTDCERLVERIRVAFTTVQVEASIGVAARHPNEGLAQAWREADQAMYQCKRRGARSPQHLLL